MPSDKQVQVAVDSCLAMQAHHVGDPGAVPHQQDMARMIPLRGLGAVDPTTVHTWTNHHAAEWLRDPFPPCRGESAAGSKARIVSRQRSGPSRDLAARVIENTRVRLLRDL